MKRILQSMLSVLFAALVVTAIAAADITLAQVVKGLTASDNTKLAAKEYWKSVDGQEVSWGGEVIEVKGGRNEADVYLADKSLPLYKGYNMIVKTYDVSKAARLKKGEKIRFTGQLDNFKPKRNGAIVIVGKARLL